MIDPKKALATQDAQGVQAEVEARSQLVEMVTGGLAPDEVATWLIRAGWWRELARVGVGIGVIFGAEWLGLRQSESYFVLFLLFVFPVWTIRDAWLPLRGRSPQGLLGDLAYQSQACAQGLLVAFLASWAGAGLIEVILGRIHHLGEFAQVVLLSTVSGLGITAATWATGRALVDREVEALPQDAVPPCDDLEVAAERLAALPLAAAIARSWFRAALVVLAFFGPIFLFDPRHSLGFSRQAIYAWSAFGAMLAASVLARQLLTVFMARSATGALLDRARALQGGDKEGAALVPESPGALAWQRTRRPLQLLAPALLTGVCGWMVAEGAMGFGSAGGYLAALGLGGLTAWRNEDSSLARVAVGAGSAALVFGFLSAAFPFLDDLARSLGRPLRILAQPLTLVAFAVLTERVLTLWSRALALVGGGDGPAGPHRDGIGAILLRGMTAGVVPGTVLFLTGMALMHMRYWRIGNTLIGASLFATAILATQVVAQLRLAEATAPAALPAEPSRAPEE